MRRAVSRAILIGIVAAATGALIWSGYRSRGAPAPAPEPPSSLGSSVGVEQHPTAPTGAAGDATDPVPAPVAGPHDAVIFGVVTLKDSGAPVPSARVACKGRRQEQGGDATDVATDASDPHGRYEVRVAFPEDLAWIEVRAPGLAPAEFQLAAPLRAGRAHRQDLALSAVPAARDLRLSVKVRWSSGAAVAGAPVSMAWGTTPGSRIARQHTDTAGVVEFVADGLPYDGTVRLTVEARADGPLTATWYPPADLTMLERDFVVPADSASLVLRALDEHGQRLDVPTRYRLSGMFGLRWTVESPSFECSGRIPADGDARVDVPARGAYRVTLDCPPGWRPDSTAPGANQLHPLTAGAHATIELRCAPAKPLGIRAMGPDGPLAGVLVTVGAVRWPDTWFLRTDEAGFAEVSVPLQAEWFTASADTPGFLTAPVLLRHPEPGPALIALTARRFGSGAIVGEIVGGPEDTGAAARFEAQAWLSPREPGAPPLAWLRSLDRTFRLRGLDPARRYDVCVRAPGWDPVWVLGVPPTEAGARVAARLERRTSSVCRGRVEMEDGDSGTEGLNVFLQPMDATGLGQVATLRGDRFELPCPPGRYRVILADSEYESAATECAVPGPDVVLPVRRAGPPPDRARIAVEVVGSVDARPIAGAEIAFATAAGAAGEDEVAWTPFAVTDETGKASFTLWGDSRRPIGLHVRAEGYDLGTATASPPWGLVRVALKPR